MDGSNDRGLSLRTSTERSESRKLASRIVVCSMRENDDDDDDFCPIRRVSRELNLRAGPISAAVAVVLAAAEALTAINSAAHQSNTHQQARLASTSMSAAPTCKLQQGRLHALAPAPV